MMEAKDAILQIKSYYNKFNETDRKIADYIVNNAEIVVNSTISNVSEALDLSDATIFRFSKKIGFKGFQELKISLALKFRDSVSDYSNEKIDKDDEQITIINKVFSKNINALKETLSSIDIQSFELATEAFLEAENIVFFGNGGSGVVANDAHHKFLRTGLKTNSYTDNHLQLMALSQLTEKDLIIVISHSGSNLNMIDLLEIAKDIGVRTISITSYLKSPIGELADISLSVISQEVKYQFEAFASRIAHLSLLDALYISVMLRRKDETKEAIKKMRAAISLSRM